MDTIDGEFRFEIIEAGDYSDDPIGRNIDEAEVFGVFVKNDHGNWILDHFYDADSLAEALLLR